MLQHSDYKPFGEQIARRGGNPERLGYKEKERDVESGLGDHGVRKYDYELGRFMSTDPLWEKYLGWNAYQYSMNNPVSFYDGNGRFSLSVHIKAIEESGVGNFLYGFVNTGYYDGLNFNAQDFHLDNKSNYDEVMDVVDKAGGFNNLNVHTLGDFFAHSNYVDIWDNLQDAGDVSGEIPLPNKVDPNSTFGVALKENLRTTTWPPNEKNDYCHNNGYNHLENNKDAFGAKDKSQKENEQNQGWVRIHNRRFNLAYDLYVRALREFHNNSNEE